MGDRRLALVIGSQCEALGALSFLPEGSAPVPLDGLPAPRRLVVDLWQLLVEGPGGCAPVRVEGEWAPGLLINPTKVVADAALTEALGRAHAQQAVLVVHFLGHGRGYKEADRASPARHLLHVWDTVAKPVDTEPESNGWDPYELIARRRPHITDLVGLVLLVDACDASWAKQQVDAWSGVGGGLLSAWLGASGDQEAWDSCFTKTLIAVLGQGLDVDEHPRKVLVPDLLVTDLEPVLAGHCRHQAPRLGGYANHNPVLTIARNRRASELGTTLGLDAGTETLLLRLTDHYIGFAVDTVVAAVRTHRVVAVLGGAGTGKSTLAAALRHPPAGVDDVPLATIHALAFATTASSLPELARTLRGQLDRLPAFPQAADRFQRANATRWDTLDVWQQQISGPLAHYPDPVRLAVDGLDQLDGQPAYPPVLRALAELVADPALGRVTLVLTSRTKPTLDGIDTVVAIPALDETTARRYLAGRDLDPNSTGRLVEVAAGNWLVLELAADNLAATCTIPDTLPALYTDLLARIHDRQGGTADVLLAVLAAVGVGPVLPFDLLPAAMARLGHPLSRVDVHTILGNPDLHRVIDRTRPGQADEHLGLFHQTLVDHLTHLPETLRGAAVHAALADAIDELAPAGRHNPASYRDDPLLAYAFDAGPRHRAQAGHFEELVPDLTARRDPIPRINLTRWITWVDPIQQSLGPEHPDTLETRLNIAAMTGEIGDPARALRLLRELLPDLERVLGPDHVGTFIARGHIAGWTGVDGHPGEALRLYQELLPDLERVLGADHRSTLAARLNIAYWTGESGDPATALRLFQELLPDLERVLGPDHPDTLATRSHIAGWTGELGDPATALRLYQELLPDRERVLGPDHPDTLATRTNIARWTRRTIG
jgi:Tetratricopeptide repeat/NACHT domain